MNTPPIQDGAFEQYRAWFKGKMGSSGSGLIMITAGGTEAAAESAATERELDGSDKVLDGVGKRAAAAVPDPNGAPKKARLQAI